MIYQNKELMLRPFRREDMTERYRSWFHDQTVTKFNAHGLFPLTDEAKERFWKEIDSGQRIVWAILGEEDLATRKGFFIHIGSASLQSISWVNRSAEFAIVIGDTSFHSKGVGTQVLKWVLEHAFIKMGLNRIWTGTSELNVGMRMVACRAGMEPEGIFKDGMWSNGRFVDVVAFGITRSQWEEARQGERKQSL